MDSLYNRPEDLEIFKKYYGSNLDLYAKDDKEKSAYVLRLAIEYKDSDVVKKILSTNRGNILTCPDKKETYYSPISSALIDYGSGIWKMVAEYIEKYGSTFTKNVLSEEDFMNIITTIHSMEKDQLANLIEKYLIPLYQDHESLRYIYQHEEKSKADTILCITDEDLASLKNNNYNFEQFVDNYAREHHLEKGDYLLSWILGAAIVLEDMEVIEKIFECNRGNILYYVNQRKYSPVSYMLHMGNQKILSAFHQYIEKYGHTFVKEDIDEDDAANIISIMYYPRLKDLPAEKCLEDLLEPIYRKESLTEIEKHVKALTWN